MYSAESPKRRWVDVGGISTPYLVAGEGTPLVLLHGVGVNSRDWSWVLPLLSQSHRVYAPDLYVLGLEDPESADLSPPGSAAFVRKFLDALGVDRCAVIGHSFSGATAVRLALSDPERVSKLVLASSTGLGRGIHPNGVSAILPGLGDAATNLAKSPPGSLTRVTGRLFLLFARPDRAPPRWIAEQIRLPMIPGFLDFGLAAARAQIGPTGQLEEESVLERLPRLQMPTLVLWGAMDWLIPVWHARRATERLARGRRVIIPDCGHLPHVERPDRFSELVLDFLKRTERVRLGSGGA